MVTLNAGLELLELFNCVGHLFVYWAGLNFDLKGDSALRRQAESIARCMASVRHGLSIRSQFHSILSAPVRSLSIWSRTSPQKVPNSSSHHSPIIYNPSEHGQRGALWWIDPVHKIRCSTVGSPSSSRYIQRRWSSYSALRYSKLTCCGRHEQLYLVADCLSYRSFVSLRGSVGLRCADHLAS